MPPSTHCRCPGCLPSIPPTPATYQADEQLAQYLLSLGFTETTGSAYHQARGWRSFYHPDRYVSVWLQPNLITLQQGKNWRHEAGAQILATTLDFLLSQAT